MTPFNCYRLYVGLKLHFSDWRYDFDRNKGSTRLSEQSFQKRKDIYWFQKLSRKRDPELRILAHVCENESCSIKDISSDDDVFFDYERRVGSLNYIFREEIKNMLPDFDQNFRYTKGQHPHLIVEYMGNRISLETLTIVSSLTGAMDYWKSKSENDALFDVMVRRIFKYKPFLEFDADVYRQTILDSFSKES